MQNHLLSLLNKQVLLQPLFSFRFIQGLIDLHPDQFVSRVHLLSSSVPVISPVQSSPAEHIILMRIMRTRIRFI